MLSKYSGNIRDFSFCIAKIIAERLPSQEASHGTRQTISSITAGLSKRGSDIRVDPDIGDQWALGAHRFYEPENIHPRSEA